MPLAYLRDVFPVLMGFSDFHGCCSIVGVSRVSCGTSKPLRSVGAGSAVAGAPTPLAVLKRLGWLRHPQARPEAHGFGTSNKDNVTVGHRH